MGSNPGYLLKYFLLYSQILSKLRLFKWVPGKAKDRNSYLFISKCPVRMGCFHFWVWQTGFDLAGQKSEETEAYMVKYLIATSFTFCLNNKNWIQILNGHKEKAKDGNFYLCSKWDSNFLAKCLVKSHDVNRCKVHYACKVMHKLLNGLAGCWLAGRPTH